MKNSKWNLRRIWQDFYLVIIMIFLYAPIATMVVALFFAVLRVGSTTMQAATGVPTSVSDIIQALVIVFSVAGMALAKLPEFQAWRNRVLGKRKAGEA